MSSMISRILGNITTRIMFIIYVTIILVTGFFIVSGYYNQLSLQEQRQHDKLKAVVTSTALSFSGDDYEQLMLEHPSKDDITSMEQSAIYNEINFKLNQSVLQNELTIPMYTLNYIPEKDVFHYGVRSDSQFYFRHEYTQYPPELLAKMETGGTLPLYESENGLWLSAFQPIRNSRGEVVGVLEADVDFTYFKNMVNEQYLRQALMSLGVIVLLAFILIPYTRKILREDEKQKQLFMKQKLLIEESHREIKDSINYAKRIQSAILPPVKLVEKSFHEAFILYKPKDVVAGDFYWFEDCPDAVLLAACDCTGHGVPGAMVSVICNNALNRAVREYGLREPASILDKTREIVISEFEKSDDEVKDGMDISLVSISKSTGQLTWAGANNPLWVLRKGAIEMEEFKPDKQPIGKYAESRPFNHHATSLNEGDTLYLFTDGYQDQFGGDKGKKFKAAKLKALLIGTKELSLKEQRQSLDQAFEAWRGKLEQIDDVCMIGVRF